MVPYIIKQSIEIRLRFENIPKITASTEICMVSGMLCRMNNFPLPNVTDTDALRKYVLSVKPSSDTAVKLYNLLAQCQKENESITDELMDAVTYGYNNSI